MNKKIDATLYIKQQNGRYKKWGLIYNIFGSAMPYGIWLIKENSHSNLEDRLISLEELENTKLVANRIKVKEEITDYLLYNSDGKSIDQIANELAKIIVPRDVSFKNVRKKGISLRNKR